MLCLSEQLLLTQRCKEAISGGSLQELLIELEVQLAGRPQEWVREGLRMELHIVLYVFMAACIHWQRRQV